MTNVLVEFVTRVEAKFVEEEEMNVNRMEQIITETANECLRKTVRIKKKKDGSRIEQKWVNDEIRREIKVRKRLNREKRGKVGEEYERAYERYKDQKQKVSKMVWEVKTAYEREMAEEMKGNKGSNKMWQMVDKLRGKEKTGGKRKKLYDGNGNELEEDMECEKMMECWTELYQRDENRVREVWSERKKNEYRIERELGMEEERRMNMQERVLLGIPRIGRVTGVKNWMSDVIFDWKEVKKRLGKIKNGKKPGPDQMKGEIYKALGRSEVCMRRMVEVYNRVLEDGVIGDGWGISRTCMIPKVNKPEAKQHRPIALTNVGYKVFMGMVKEKISGRFMSDERVEDLQSGFTDGRWMEENLFALGVCVNECYVRKSINKV